MLRRFSSAPWLLGVVGAVSLHAGGLAFAVSHSSEPDPDSVDGAPVIEIGIALESPRTEATDLPPGPEAEASAASPAVMEQTAKVEETALPQEQPTETEDPDRLVTREVAQDPKEKEPDPAQAQANPSSESVASEATAAPSLETEREAAKAVAPVQGVGQSADRVKAAWQKQLVAHLDRHKRYPAEAARRNVELTVSFTLDRMGHVVAAHVIKGSGDAGFDAAALSMMRRADPVPRPPAMVADEGLNFTLPVIFRAKDRG